MPPGHKGEKRPADLIGNAVKVMRIATGEETDDAAKALGAKGVALAMVADATSLAPQSDVAALVKAGRASSRFAAALP
jgi:hypothetical protein